MISDVCYDFVSGHIQRYDLPGELKYYTENSFYDDWYQGEVRDLCNWAISAAQDPMVPLAAITATLDRVANILAASPDTEAMSNA